MTNVRLVQLVDGGIDMNGNMLPRQPYDFAIIGDKRTYPDMVTKAGLADIKTYAAGSALGRPTSCPPSSSTGTTMAGPMTSMATTPWMSATVCSWVQRP